MQLFETLDDLKPFIFRILDNGGRTCDRFTVITCDGDYFAMSPRPFHPQGFGQTGEGIDLQHVEESVESGYYRDLRWIDLPEDCQRCVWQGLNQGFADYVDKAPVADSREDALNFEGWADWTYTARQKPFGALMVTPIYKVGDSFYVRRDDYAPDPDPDFESFRAAFLYTLPEDYDLAGPEYHTPVDLWDETGGPAPLWEAEDED